jgi:cyclohexanecarboxylate-CoA ligase
MTEYGIGISAHPGMARRRVDATDGLPVPGCEVRVTGEGGDVPAGEPGALEIRGAGLFSGYYEDADATVPAIDEDGWFSTGDVARILSGGELVLEGRTKDIVIRGGENIPVAEVETVLYRHPGIVEAAIVGVPDTRLGERACAIVVPEDPTAPPDLPSIVAFCLEEGLSKHHLPERLQLVDALPRTMSGKVRKAELRERFAR